MGSFHAISVVSQVDKKVTENDNKNTYSTTTNLCQAPLNVEGLEDTILRHETIVITTKSRYTRATDKTKPGQNEANSGESSVLLQESRKKFLDKNVDLSVTLPFHPHQELKWLYMNQIASDSLDLL